MSALALLSSSRNCIPRMCSHKCIYNKRKIDKSQKEDIKFVIASKNTAKTLDAAKKPLNLIALFVQFLIVVPRIFTIAFWRNNRHIAKLHCQSSRLHPPHKPGPSRGKPDDPLDRAVAKGHGLPDHRHSFPQTTKRLPHPDQMRRPYEVWCSIHPVFFRWIEFRFFQGAHSIWMNLRSCTNRLKPF